MWSVELGQQATPTAIWLNREVWVCGVTQRSIKRFSMKMSTAQSRVRPYEVLSSQKCSLIPARFFLEFFLLGRMCVFCVPQRRIIMSVRKFSAKKRTHAAGNNNRNAAFDNTCAWFSEVSATLKQTSAAARTSTPVREHSYALKCPYMTLWQPRRGLAGLCAEICINAWKTAPRPLLCGYVHVRADMMCSYRASEVQNLIALKWVCVCALISYVELLR